MSQLIDRNSFRLPVCCTSGQPGGLPRHFSLRYNLHRFTAVPDCRENAAAVLRPPPRREWQPRQARNFTARNYRFSTPHRETTRAAARLVCGGSPPAFWLELATVSPNRWYSRLSKRLVIRSEMKQQPAAAGFHRRRSATSRFAQELDHIGPKAGLILR